MKNKIIFIILISILIFVISFSVFIEIETSNIEDEFYILNKPQEITINIEDYIEDKLEINTIHDISFAFSMFYEEYFSDFNFSESKYDFKNNIYEYGLTSNIEKSYIKINIKSSMENYPNTNITISLYMNENEESLEIVESKFNEIKTNIEKLINQKFE